MRQHGHMTMASFCLPEFRTAIEQCRAIVAKRKPLWREGMLLVVAGSCRSDLIAREGAGRGWGGGRAYMTAHCMGECDSFSSV